MVMSNKGRHEPFGRLSGKPLLKIAYKLKHKHKPIEVSMPFLLYPPHIIVHWLMIKLLSRHRLLPLVVEGYVRHIKPNRVRLLIGDFQNSFGLGAKSSLKTRDVLTKPRITRRCD